MAQNIYDDAAFFEGYRQFPRSAQGLSAAAEWPSLRAMLPPMAGLEVLDLGCGFGYFCRWAVEQGASRVTGLDLSEKMLAEAERNCAGLPVTLAALLVSIEPIVDMGRTAVNVCGAMTAGTVTSQLLRQTDGAVMRAQEDVALMNA